MQPYCATCLVQLPEISSPRVNKFVAVPSDEIPTDGTWELHECSQCIHKFACLIEPKIQRLFQRHDDMRSETT